MTRVHNRGDVSIPKQTSKRRTGRPPRLIVRNPSWARQLGQGSAVPVARLARVPPFGPPGRAPHGVLDEALIQGVVIAHRGELVGERIAVNVLKRTGRFVTWYEDYKPKRGPSPRDPIRAAWLFAAVEIAKAAMKRKGLTYSEPSPAGLAEVWEVLTGSSERPRRLYRRYQNLQVHIRMFERAPRDDG